MKFGLFGGPRETAIERANGNEVNGYQIYIDRVIEAEKLGYFSNFIGTSYSLFLNKISE